MPETARRLHSVPAEESAAPAPALEPLERLILGTAMESPADLSAIRAVIGAKDFYDPRHAELWQIITAAADGGAPTSAVAVNEAALRSGLLMRLPSPAYVFTVYQEAQRGQGAYHAKLLRERARHRDMLVRTAGISQLLRSPAAEPASVAALAQELAGVATADPTAENRPVRVSDLVDQYLDTYMTYEAEAGFPTPWSDMNRLLTPGGFKPGQLVIFGGASGMGKSVALTDCVRHLGVLRQVPTLMFTLEMAVDDVMFRLLAGLTGVPERFIKNRELDPQQLVKVEAAREKIAAAPVWLKDGRPTVPQIVEEARLHRATYGALDVVAVDYVQLVPPDSRKENRQIEVSSVVQHLKGFALQDKVAILAAAQINRGPAQRADKTPTMADLRESGEIENSSDVVILVYRPEYYDAESPRSGEVDFIVAKQRGGCTDTITLAAQLHLTRFVDMAIA